ncbi:MAG: hypothetical protein ACJ79H_18415 [Myxococcales bacterium]
MRLSRVNAVLFASVLTASARADTEHPFVLLQHPFTLPSNRGVSPQLRHLPIDRSPKREVDIPVGRSPRVPAIAGFVDGIRQDWTAWYDAWFVPTGMAAPTPLIGFAGVNTGAMPPDPDGAVGPNHYVQVVNFAVTIFNKSGTILRGPIGSNTIWANLPGVCSTDVSGDAVVLYDSAADRWVISQMAGFEHLPDSHQCVAVSATGDPLGAYNLYQVGPIGLKNDYPKLGIWSDAYYLTYNGYDPSGSFVHTTACALDRTSMIQGLAMRDPQCINLPSQYFGLLPADLDGARPPPASAPNYLAALIGTNAIGIWQFFVNWTNPASTTLAGPISLATAPFSDAPGINGFAPQAGTTNLLETLGDRLMYRLAYRNFGDHEAMVANHTVSTTVGGATVTGLRWYEIRIANGVPAIFQQSTYAPDSDDRFMASAALDQSGNLAIGFSLSGSTRFPEIRYTGRIAIDTLNAMTQGDNTAIASSGFQDGADGFRSRWGDYSRMTLDPVDDCTFWYTSEYLTFSGEGSNWRTRLQSFKLPGCPTNWFAIAASPATTSASATISSTPFAGFSGAISLSASGLPGGATYSFSPSAIGAPASSTLTLNPGSSTAGTYPITITGTEGGVSRSVVISWNDPGCTPTASCAGKNCGTVNNGCGVTLTCGTCTGGMACTNNVCQCPAGFIVCSGQCVDASRNPNCGTCGFSCPRGEVCAPFPGGGFDCTCSVNCN